MPIKKDSQVAVDSPFVVGKDGRVYISKALILSATITGSRATGLARAVS